MSAHTATASRGSMVGCISTSSQDVASNQAGNRLTRPHDPGGADYSATGVGRHRDINLVALAELVGPTYDCRLFPHALKKQCGQLGGVHGGQPKGGSEHGRL